MLLRGWRIVKLGWIDYTLLRLGLSFAGVFLQVWMQNYQMLNVPSSFSTRYHRNVAQIRL